MLADMDLLNFFKKLLSFKVFILTAKRCIIKLLSLWLSSLLLVLHFFSEFSLNNGKSQIQQEKGSNEDDWVEIGTYPGTY